MNEVMYNYNQIIMLEAQGTNLVVRDGRSPYTATRLRTSQEETTTSLPPPPKSTPQSNNKRPRHHIVDFAIAASATSCACVLSNPVRWDIILYHPPNEDRILQADLHTYPPDKSVPVNSPRAALTSYSYASTIVQCTNTLHALAISLPLTFGCMFEEEFE